MRWFSATEAVNSLHIPNKTCSFSARRLKRWSAAHPESNRCRTASALPCCSILSMLNNSERSGSSSASGISGRGQAPILAIKWRNCPMNFMPGFNSGGPLWRKGRNGQLARLMSRSQVVAASGECVNRVTPPRTRGSSQSRYRRDLACGICRAPSVR